MTLDELQVWVPSIVSIVTLILNMSYYILIQSRLGYMYNRKENLAKICEDF